MKIAILVICNIWDQSKGNDSSDDRGDDKKSNRINVG